MRNEKIKTRNGFQIAYNIREKKQKFILLSVLEHVQKIFKNIRHYSYKYEIIYLLYYVYLYTNKNYSLYLLIINGLNMSKKQKYIL